MAHAQNASRIFRSDCRRNGLTLKLGHVQIDCSARASQSMSADKYDPQSRAFLGSVNLTGQSAPKQIGGDYGVAAHLAQVTC
jgi:hypothetical protein